MRKLAPAFIITTFVTLAGASAFAADAMSTDKPASAKPAAIDSSMSAPDPAARKKLKQTARNDDRCDSSKQPAGTMLPKECYEKSGTGAAASNSTQKQSGGDGGAGSGAASSGAAGGAGSGAGGAGSGSSGGSGG